LFVNPQETEEELAARVAMAAELRRLGHSLVAHKVDEALCHRVAQAASELTGLVEARPPRDRAAEFASGPRMSAFLAGTSSAQPVGDGEVMDLFRDSVVSGRANPMGVAMTVRRIGSTAVGTTTLGPSFEGAPRRAHGGVVAAILDEVMGHVLPIVGEVAYTAHLSIDYVAPTPLGVPLTFTARLRDRADRKLWIEASGACGAEPFVRSEALFLCVDVAAFAHRQDAQ
jgi:hypothetical protein